LLWLLFLRLLFFYTSALFFRAFIALFHKMFQVSRWCLVMTPKAALHILGMLPSPSTTFLSSSSSVEKGKEGNVLSTVPHAIHHLPPSCASSTYLSSQLLEQWTPAKVKKAYIARTLLCHPDLFPDDPLANEKFQHLGEALRVALQVLQTHRPQRRHGDGEDTTLGSHPPCNGGMETIHDAMATFRRCMVAFYRHKKGEKRRKTLLSRQVRKTGEEGGVSQSIRPKVSRDPLQNENEREAENEAKGKENDEDEDPHFVRSVLDVPSLEHIRDVCQREHTALLQTQELCAVLPSLLSGEGTALFDSTAFFFTRYVSLTLSCVSRFIHHLPILVRRVVMQRKRRMRSTFARPRPSSPPFSSASPSMPLNAPTDRASDSTATSAGVRWPAASSPSVAIGGTSNRVVYGLGTGSRPHTQKKIEDMAMKPLVLMGVLIFDTVSGSDASDRKHVGKQNGEERALEKEQEGKGENTKQKKSKSSLSQGRSLEGEEEEGIGHETIDKEEAMDQSSTCPGVFHPSDVKVCRELQCCIHPTDTVEMIVNKLSSWEQRSFERLQVELAMADVTALWSDLMGLPLDSSPSTSFHSSRSRETSPSLILVRPNLEAPLEEAAGVLEMVQMLARDMCAYQEDSLDHLYSEEVVLEHLRRKKEKREGSSCGRGEREKSVSTLVSHFLFFLLVTQIKLFYNSV